MFLYLFLFLFGSVSIVSGETLKEVLRYAEENSPYIKQLVYQLKTFEGEIRKSKAIPNPEIEIEFGRLVSQTDSGIALTLFTLSQQLRLWGEREFAVKSAKLKKKAFSYLYTQKRWQFLGNIYKQFYSSLYTKYKLRIKERELENLQSVYRYIKESYRLGENTELDLLRAEKDLQIVKGEISTLKEQYKSSMLILSSMIGKEIKDIDTDIFSFPEFRNINLNQLPVFKYYSIFEKSLNYQIKRQKALKKPLLRVGVVLEEDPVDLGKYEMGVSISSTIPVFYRQEGEILSLANRKKQIILQKKQVELEYEGKIRSIERQIKALKRQIEKINKTSVINLQKALKLAERSYKLQTITFFEYSNIRKQYFELLLYRLSLANQIHQLYGEYIKITGLKGGIR